MKTPRPPVYGADLLWTPADRAHKRPAIDLDLGNALQFGYRRFKAAVHHHGPPPPINLRAARLGAHLTLTKLAELLNVSITAVNNYERGRQPCPALTRTRWAEVCWARTPA